MCVIYSHPHHKNYLVEAGNNRTIVMCYLLTRACECLKIKVKKRRNQAAKIIYDDSAYSNDVCYVTRVYYYWY